MLFVIHIVSSHSTDEDNYNKNVSISMRTMTIFYRHVLNEMFSIKYGEVAVGEQIA